MRKSHFAIFDLETGGFEPKENPITEVGIKIVDSVEFKELGSYQSLVKPYGGLKLENTALEKTGLTRKLLEEEGKEHKVVLKEIIAFLKEHKVGKYNKPILVAHNFLFDYDFLSTLFLEFGENLRDHVASAVGDTIFLSKLVWDKHLSKSEGENSKYKLASICEKLDINLDDAHRSMGDVDATTEVVSKITSSIRSGNIVSDSSDVKEDVHDWKKQSEQDSDRIRETFEIG